MSIPKPAERRGKMEVTLIFIATKNEICKTLFYLLFVNLPMYQYCRASKRCRRGMSAIAGVRMLLDDVSSKTQRTRRKSACYPRCTKETISGERRIIKAFAKVSVLASSQ